METNRNTKNLDCLKIAYVPSLPGWFFASRQLLVWALERNLEIYPLII